MRFLRTLLPVLLLFAVVPSAANAGGVSVVGAHQVLYRGGTNGYGCFRIPVLSRTASGTLLAFAEARKSPTCADRGAIDLVVRRSTNDGRTWGPIRVVTQGTPTDQFAPFTRGNAVPVIDRTDGKILLVTTSNDATLTGRRLPWIQQSTDDGLTWTAPKPLGATMDGTNDGWFATGPAHGIQLEHGEHKNRLIVGAHQKPADGVVKAGVLYSDNHGESWQASETENSFVKDELSPGEITVTELPGGAVYAGARNEIDGSPGHRAMAVSTDGGTKMPKFSLVPSLVTPNVQGSVLALKNTYRTTPGDVLIFSAPADPDDRKQMRIRYSTDRGMTWVSAPNGLVTNDRSSYSDMAELTGGEIGLLYEGGTTHSADEIRFTRFTPAQLGLPGTTRGTPSSQPAQAAGPTTPDSTPEANDAYLKANATINDGLLLDGTGDYADVPYSRTIDPGSGDFTLSLKFRYQATASTRDQVLFWGYGTGTGVPQMWIRLQPDDDQVTAWVQGAGSGANASVKDGTATVAFGDNTWHQLTVVRTGGQMRLTVGTASATADGIAGPVSGGTTGIRLGAKQDAAVSDALAGRIKDVELTRDGKRVLDLAMTKVDGAVVPGRTAPAITEDVSGHCATATVLGGIQTEAGRPRSRALKVDSSHPGVEAPFSPALDLGTGDFTMVAWFKYSATTNTPNQALLWAYGTTSGKRSVWVRAQPGQDRLFAWLETDTSSVDVALTDTDRTRTAFGDNAWHLLALTRTGGQVQLSVDGGNPATATGLTGSVSADQADGIKGLRLGSKMDGTDVMQGSLDDFRLYHRALTDAELDTATTTRFPAGTPALWWTFENQNTQAHDVVDPVTGPQTPDASVHCVNAKVLGAPAVVAGRYGTGLQFDGTDDEAYMPYRPSIALADSDFTVSAWVKYSATGTTGDQVILWAYGTGATERSMWLRAQPAKDRIYGYLQTDTGAYEMSVPDLSAAAGFGDNTWHLVTIRRSGNTLELLVDNSRSSGPVAGSLTYGDTFAVDGIRLGVKPDGTNRFKGTMDEFRIHRRALGDTELTGNVDFGPVTAVHLPFTNAS